MGRDRTTTGAIAVVLTAIAVAAGCGGDGGSSGAGPTTTTTTSDPPITVAPTTAAVTTVPPVTTVPATTVVAPADDVDWRSWIYVAECGMVDEFELVEGEFRPEAYNDGDSSLVATFVSAEPIPTRPDHTLVQVQCVAGGATGAFSSQLHFVMLEGPDGVEQQLVVVGEPDAIHVVNDDGTVVITDTTYGASDPNCCPSVFRARQIVWDDDAPVEVAGSRPDAEPVPIEPGGCVSSELDLGWPDADEVRILEDALAAAGFDPGESDGRLDDATIAAVVRLIEFNAGNPALARGDDRPYDNLHAEASRFGVVREPVLTLLGVACDDLAWLPSR